MNAPTDGTGSTTDPTQPGKPTPPTQAVGPTEPTQPSQLAQPVDPTEPTQGFDPTEPTQPTQPVGRDLPDHATGPGPLIASESNEAAALVVQQELALLNPAVRADAERLDELLHPDFVEYGASGRVWTRQAIIDELPLEDESTPITSAHNIGAEQLAQDVILVTYRTTSAVKVANRSSIWVRHQGRWHLKFHQGTPTQLEQNPAPANPVSS